MPASSGWNNGLTWSLVRVVNPYLAIWYYSSPPFCLQPSCPRQMAQLVTLCHIMPNVSPLPLHFCISRTLWLLNLLPIIARTVPPQLGILLVLLILSLPVFFHFLSLLPIWFSYLRKYPPCSLPSWIVGWKLAVIMTDKHDTRILGKEKSDIWEWN